MEWVNGFLFLSRLEAINTYSITNTERERDQLKSMNRSEHVKSFFITLKQIPRSNSNEKWYYSVYNLYRIAL